MLEEEKEALQNEVAEYEQELGKLKVRAVYAMDACAYM
jgi:hypothetical protein